MAFIERDSLIIRAIREDETSDANAIMNGSMTGPNDYSGSTSDSNNTTEDNTNDNPADDTNTDDANNTDNNEENTDDNGGGDDDFNIDTSLDTDGDGNDDIADSSSSSSTTYSSEADSDTEVNDANTDIYSSLTAEEQAQKIMELKNQYKELYTACNELLIKLNNIDVESYSSIISLGRISKTIYSLKNYIKDYFINTFPYRSIIQNDIMYNRFLMIYSSVAPILTDVNKIDDSERKDK